MGPTRFELVTFPTSTGRNSHYTTSPGYIRGFPGIYKSFVTRGSVRNDAGAALRAGAITRAHTILGSHRRLPMRSERLHRPGESEIPDRAVTWAATLKSSTSTISTTANFANGSNGYYHEGRGMPHRGGAPPSVRPEEVSFAWC